MAEAPFTEISVSELAVKLADGDRRQFVDVREPQELAIASLPQFVNFPLSEYGQWSANILQTLDPTLETVVLCHHGMRSAQMCGWLADQGFTQICNVTGGIAAYAQLVDRSVPQY
jgi:rhodanese-related sulfurtransferase